MRTSLSQELAVAQALQGKEALLTDTIEKEMAHRTQVSILSQHHFRQAEEIKAEQSQEIKNLSTLLKKQHAIQEKIQEEQFVSWNASPSATNI